MIGIIDYGVGNLKSVYNSLNYLNKKSRIINSKEDFKFCNGFILPGVGAFSHGVENLIKSGLYEEIIIAKNQGVPILGICLGMQILFSTSEEGCENQDIIKGLDLIKGEVVKLKGDIKIPHIGWNSLCFNKLNTEDNILNGIEEMSYVYFVHSYMAKTQEKNIIAYANYGENRIPAIVKSDNLVGMQFHPEKSGEIGLKLLENFSKLIENRV